MGHPGGLIDYIKKMREIEAGIAAAAVAGLPVDDNPTNADILIGILRTIKACGYRVAVDDAKKDPPRCVACGRIWWTPNPDGLCLDCWFQVEGEGGV